jgi:hypothetical protein
VRTRDGKETCYKMNQECLIFQVFAVDAAACSRADVSTDVRSRRGMARIKIFIKSNLTSHVRPVRGNRDRRFPWASWRRQDSWSRLQGHWRMYGHGGTPAVATDERRNSLRKPKARSAPETASARRSPALTKELSTIPAPSVIP